MGATIIGGSTSFTQRFSSESVAVANPLAIKRRYVLGGSTRYAFDFSAYVTFEYLNPRLLWNETSDNNIAPRTWGVLPTIVSIQKLILSELDNATTARILYIDPVTNEVSYGNAPAVFPGFTDLFTDYGFTDNSADWDTAYGWGDHALAGYLIAETDPDFNAWILATPPLYPGGWYDAVQNTIPLSAFNDDLSYLTVETDPIFTASDVFGITTANINDWNSAFGWGDHGLAGYVVGMPALTDLTDVFGTPTEDKQFPVWNQAELRFEFDETIIDIEGIPLTEKTKLEDDTNWNPLTYAYVGVAIAGTFVGQRHYDADYMFHCVGSDNNWIRLPRA